MDLVLLLINDLYFFYELLVWNNYIDLLKLNELSLFLLIFEVRLIHNVDKHHWVLIHFYLLVKELGYCFAYSYLQIIR